MNMLEYLKLSRWLRRWVPQENLVMRTKSLIYDIGELTYLIDSSGNNNHLLVISGTVYPLISVQAPTGHALADIGPFAGEAIVYIPDLAQNEENQIFWDDVKGMLVYSSAQTDTVSRKVLAYLNEPFWPQGMVSAADVFDSVNDRGEELSTSYAGDQYLNGVNIGANPAVSTKGLDIGPARTNLFTSGPTGAELKTLTAQNYCLQCVGGSVSCSYGTATPTTPLQFTATAGDTTFTPTDCTSWMLSAFGGYVYDYIPPQATHTSSAATSGGNGASIEMEDSVLAALNDKCTVMTEMFMGVGSGELSLDEFVNVYSTKNVKFAGGVYLERSGGDVLSIVKSSEGTAYPSITGVSWNRNEVHKRVVQTSTDGTQFKVGYRRFESDGITPISAWVWSSYSAFDGSFDPLDFLRFGYLNTVPMWLRNFYMWNRGDVTEAELNAPLEMAS